MKKIYKLPKGVIVMMIAVMGIATQAGTLQPSSSPGPKYVLYSPTNLQVNVIEGCLAYLTWDKPQTPGGITPDGLMGYKIYRDGALIHYDSDPDSLFYYEYVDNVGNFTDSVTAYYDLTAYGSPGQYGESVATSASFFTTCGQILPFYEPWDQASFFYQDWSFLPSQGNWAISTTQGNPLPTALFTGTPVLLNYDHTLQSIHLDCIPWICANVYIEFDIRLNSNNQTSQEKMIIEIYYDTAWHPIDTLVNDISTGWVHHKIDITGASGYNIRIGFRATGINSADISEWDIDNIYVYAVCFKPPDFNLNRTGNIVHLTWGTPCTGKKLKPDKVESSTLLGYNIYRTDESGLPPFVKLNTAMISDTEYTDVLATTFDGVACYYVTAVYQDPYNPPLPFLCESPSDTLCFQYTAGIPEKNESQVRIFPNPVIDVLNIETDLAFTGIEVLNFIGEKVYTETFLPSKNVCINIKDYQPGIYLLKLRSGKETVVEKVLKN